MLPTVNHNSTNKTSEQFPKPTTTSKRIEAKAPVEPFNRERWLTVVGAGGLKALCPFITALPSVPNRAFVVIPYLHGEHISDLPELGFPYEKLDTEV